MKQLTSILVALAALFGCLTPAFAQDAEEQGETNQIINGVRQGFWRVEGRNGKVDEGNYTDGKKNGLWISYGLDGGIRSKITYAMGKTQGPAEMYDANGVLTESGIWNVDHWEGNYVRYNYNGGKACEFFYDDRGRRQGKQIYYHENGKVMYEGVWNEGKITGILTAYDDNGHKILERNYGTDGKFVSAVEIPVNATEAPPRKFTGTGTYTLYNLKGKVDQKGEFVKGELVNGEKYVYKEDGTLQYREVYVNGEFTKRAY